MGYIGPVGKVHYCTPWESGQGDKAPIGEVHFALPGVSWGRRVGCGPGRGCLGPGQWLDGGASGVGSVVAEGELVGDRDERRDGNAGGMADAAGDGGDGGVVNQYHRRVMVSAHQRGRQGGARLLKLNHWTLSASAGDSGK